MYAQRVHFQFVPTKNAITSHLAAVESDFTAAVLFLDRLYR